MNRPPSFLAIASEETAELRAVREDLLSAAESQFSDWCAEHGYEGESERAIDRMLAHAERAKLIREGGL